MFYIDILRRKKNELKISLVFDVHFCSEPYFSVLKLDLPILEKRIGRKWRSCTSTELETWLDWFIMTTTNGLWSTKWVPIKSGFFVNLITRPKYVCHIHLWMWWVQKAMPDPGRVLNQGVWSDTNFEYFFLGNSIIKVHIFWEGHNFFQNIHRRFVLCCSGQIYGGDLPKFCGLLRIYELYHHYSFYSWNKKLPSSTSTWNHALILFHKDTSATQCISPS